MTKSQANNYGGVRKKLMGAVAMLLVASIMVVSSTYAWFTLSTAPEITGISTSVGANGNLEIALLTDGTDGANMSTISSAVGDSSDAAGRTSREANITWGNLVDLSDSSYGTGSFVLNPARLNANAGTQTLDATNILLTAKYGNDGRVSELAANTVSGTYSTAKTAFVDSGVGVRGIGVAAAMTAEQLALRNAVAQVALNTNNAKVGISNALTSNGSKLASLAMSYANNANYEPTDGDITAINSVRVSVSDAKNLLGNAIRYAMMAEALSKSATASKDYSTYDLNDALNDTENTSIKNAVTALNAIPDVETATSSNLKEVLDTLIDTTTMTINGFTTAQTRNDANASQLASKVMSDGGLKVVLPANGASAFAKVAELTGNFSANITIETLSHGSISLTNVKASMATDMTGTYAMATVGSAIAGLSAAASTTVTPGDTVITDMYGYAVDFAVRTNAAGSNLLLQVEEAQRIYSDGDNVSTQGGGSYMQFTKGSDLTEDQFRDLLGAVRVVFTDGSSNIKMVAVLDVANAVADAEENAGANASISGAKIRLLPVAYTIAEATGNTAGKLTVTKDDQGAYVTPEDNSIMALEQNAPAKVTATVYLDGDIVDNSMVSATAARSMTGTMNLQFASSAALVPMDYTPLHSMDASEPAQQNP